MTYDEYRTRLASQFMEPLRAWAAQPGHKKMLTRKLREFEGSPKRQLVARWLGAECPSLANALALEEIRKSAEREIQNMAKEADESTTINQ